LSSLAVPSRWGGKGYFDCDQECLKGFRDFFFFISDLGFFFVSILRGVGDQIAQDPKPAILSIG